MGTGDTPGATPRGSCTPLEVVVQNTYHRGFPMLYNSCTGRHRTARTTRSSEPSAHHDFKLQNARPAPYCLYSQGSTSYFPPVGNCFGYVANEWMTFQLRIKTGPRVGDEFVDSHVTLWAARQGKPSELLFDWGPYNLTRRRPGAEPEIRQGLAAAVQHRQELARRPTPSPTPGTTT